MKTYRCHIKLDLLSVVKYFCSIKEIFLNTLSGFRINATNDLNYAKQLPFILSLIHGGFKSANLLFLRIIIIQFQWNPSRCPWAYYDIDDYSTTGFTIPHKLLLSHMWCEVTHPQQCDSVVWVRPVCVVSLYTSQPNVRRERDREDRGERRSEMIKATVERGENSVWK